MRLEIVDEARDFAESFGPHNISTIKIEEVGDTKDLVLVSGDYTIVFEDVQGWAEFLMDRL